MDVLLEAIIADEATSGFAGGRIVSIPIMIEKIAYSKNAEEVIDEEGFGAEAKECHGAGKKDISETRCISYILPIYRFANKYKDTCPHGWSSYN